MKWRILLELTEATGSVQTRDRALISVMTFAFARIGAVVAMRVEDYYPKGKQVSPNVSPFAMEPCRIVRPGPRST